MTPMVGIFWYDFGHVIHFADSLDHATATGDFVDTEKDHYRTWKNMVKLNPKFRFMEYEEVPRGRVVYNKKRQVYIVYSSFKLANNKRFRAAITESFNLKYQKTEFISDFHYEDPSYIN